MPFFSSRIAASAAFAHGVCGSVCRTQTPTSQYFFQNKPSMVCSRAPSMMMVFKVPSLWTSWDSPLCARDFFGIRNARHQPSGVAKIWAYLLLWGEAVLDLNDVSVKQFMGSCLYRCCLSFVPTRHDKDECRTNRTPRWVVVLIIRLAVWRLMPRLSASHVRASNCLPGEEGMFPANVVLTMPETEKISRVGIVCQNDRGRPSWLTVEDMLETLQRRCDGGGAPVRSPVRHVFHFVSSCWANETSYGSYVSLSLVREKCGSDS